jgi:hypothetical protein
LWEDADLSPRPLVTTSAVLRERRAVAGSAFGAIGAAYLIPVMAGLAQLLHRVVESVACPMGP